MLPWLTGPSDRAASAVGQEITGVRTGLHDGYDRVVLDLTGSDPELGWFAGFTDEAIADPSGRPLDVDGDAADAGARVIRRQATSAGSWWR